MDKATPFGYKCYTFCYQRVQSQHPYIFLADLGCVSAPEFNSVNIIDYEDSNGTAAKYSHDNFIDAIVC